MFLTPFHASLYRRDPPTIGTDEWDKPLLKHYFCQAGKCAEVHDLECERTCDGVSVDTGAVNAVVLKGETVVAARCNSVQVEDAEQSEDSSVGDQLGWNLS